MIKIGSQALSSSAFDRVPDELKLDSALIGQRFDVPDQCEEQRRQNGQNEPVGSCKLFFSLKQGQPIKTEITVDVEAQRALITAGDIDSNTVYDPTYMIMRHNMDASIADIVFGGRGADGVGSLPLSVHADTPAQNYSSPASSHSLPESSCGATTPHLSQYSTPPSELSSERNSPSEIAPGRKAALELNVGARSQIRDRASGILKGYNRITDKALINMLHNYYPNQGKEKIRDMISDLL